MDATANNAITVLRSMTILRQRYIAPNLDRALEVGIILENRYQLRRVPDSTLREPRLIRSSWNRVGKFEGLKGRKARYFRDLLHFCRVQNLAQMLDGKDIETSSAALGYVFI